MFNIEIVYKCSIQSDPGICPCQVCRRNFLVSLGDGNSNDATRKNMGKKEDGLVWFPKFALPYSALQFHAHSLRYECGQLRNRS